MRLSEIYTSIQGEGPRAGTPTQFIRFAGCNLRCPGWPCDTPHAIDPRIFEREQVRHSPESLLGALPEWPASLCLTGGEPFIQPRAELQEFTALALREGYTIEAFTNGTVEYPTWALENINFVMDWKLPGSGENPDNPVRRRNAHMLKATDYIKFVIKDWADFVAAKQIWIDMTNLGVEPVWSFGAVWGVSTAEIIGWVLEHQLPWQLNVQVHNYIWDRDKRGI